MYRVIVQSGDFSLFWTAHNLIAKGGALRGHYVDNW